MHDLKIAVYGARDANGASMAMRLVEHATGTMPPRSTFVPGGDFPTFSCVWKDTRLTLLDVTDAAERFESMKQLPGESDTTYWIETPQGKMQMGLDDRALEAERDAFETVDALVIIADDLRDLTPAMCAVIERPSVARFIFADRIDRVDISIPQCIKDLRSHLPFFTVQTPKIMHATFLGYFDALDGLMHIPPEEDTVSSMWSSSPLPGDAWHRDSEDEELHARRLELVETVLQQDVDAMDAFLGSDVVPPVEELTKLFSEGIIGRRIFPLMFRPPQKENFMEQALDTITNIVGSGVEAKRRRDEAFDASMGVLSS